MALVQSNYPLIVDLDTSEAVVSLLTLCMRRVYGVLPPTNFRLLPRVEITPKSALGKGVLIERAYREID